MQSAFTYSLSAAVNAPATRKNKQRICGSLRVALTRWVACSVAKRVGVKSSHRTFHRLIEAANDAGLTLIRHRLFLPLHPADSHMPHHITCILSKPLVALTGHRCSFASPCSLSFTASPYTYSAPVSSSHVLNCYIRAHATLLPTRHISMHPLHPLLPLSAGPPLLPLTLVWSSC